LLKKNDFYVIISASLRGEVMRSPIEKYSQIIDMAEDGYNFQEIVRESDYSKSELLLALNKLITTDLKLPYHIKFNLTQEYLNNLSFANFGGKKTIIISDTHLASIYENLDYIEKTKQFINDNNIKYLLHGGDIGDGMVECSKKYSTHERQVSHILDIYPEFEHCKQYLLGGNHDRRYKDKNMDILKLLEEKKNIENIGYYQAYFKLFDKLISFEHNSLMNKSEFLDIDFTILGHAHNLYFKNQKMKLAPLCDCFMDSTNANAGFVIMSSKKQKKDVELSFDCYNISDNEISKVKTKKYII